MSPRLTTRGSNPGIWACAKWQQLVYKLSESKITMKWIVLPKQTGAVKMCQKCYKFLSKKIKQIENITQEHLLSKCLQDGAPSKLQNCVRIIWQDLWVTLGFSELWHLDLISNLFKYWLRKIHLNISVFCLQTASALWQCCTLLYTYIYIYVNYFASDFVYFCIIWNLPNC